MEEISQVRKRVLWNLCILLYLNLEYKSEHYVYENYVCMHNLWFASYCPLLSVSWRRWCVANGTVGKEWMLQEVAVCLWRCTLTLVLSCFCASWVLHCPSTHTPVCPKERRHMKLNWSWCHKQNPSSLLFLVYLLSLKAGNAHRLRPFLSSFWVFRGRVSCTQAGMNLACSWT